MGRRYYFPGEEKNAAEKIRNRLFRKPVPTFPKTVVVETIYGCNAGCVFCSYPELSKSGLVRKGRMSDETFAKIAGDCAGQEVERFILCFDNEPLLDRALGRRFALLRRTCPGAKLNLTTNASLLDEKRFEELIASGLTDEVFLSVNGNTKETYESLMKLPYDKVFANLEHFCRRLRELPALKKRLRVRVNVMKMGEVEPELPAMKKRWKDEAGFELHVIEPDNRAGDVDLEKFAAHGTKKASFAPFINCRRPFHTLVLTWEGEAVLCCADYRREVKLGNVAERSLSEIWNGSPATDLRRQFLRGDYTGLDICRRCFIRG